MEPNQNQQQESQQELKNLQIQANEAKQSQEEQQTKRKILLKVEGSIPSQIKNNLKKTYFIKPFDFNEFSNSLTRLVHNNAEISQQLFDGKQDVLEKSGDILAKTLHKYWTINEDIYSIYVENLN